VSTDLRHTALVVAPGQRLDAGGLTDRVRLSIVFQASSLLSHLRLAGWQLERGWSGAAVDSEGLLRSLRACPGPPAEWPQEELLELVALLFKGRHGEVAGRGQARRVVRELVGRWSQGLVPLPPDQAVGQVLESAGFLWEKAFSRSRAALVGEHRRGARRSLWVAGPGHLRRALLRGVSEHGELIERATTSVSAGYGADAEGVGRSRTLARARALLLDGRFLEAEEAARSVAGGAGRSLRVVCLVRLGRLEAARRELNGMTALPRAEESLLELAEAAARLYGHLGEPAAAERWVSRALAASTGPRRSRAHLLAAFSAWDRDDGEAMERSLRRAEPALDQPDFAWRWRHAAALAALRCGEAAAAAAELTRALGSSRRRMSGFEAATLWNDLGVARAESDDLAGAERALLHTVRLHARVEGPSRTTLALCNLAELRLRRGVLRGVREAIDRSLEANRTSGNWRALAYDYELWSRYELVRGRPEAALEHARRALEELERRETDWRRSELNAVAARALGWLGHERQAAKALGAVAEGRQLPFEAEELPALYALAGDRVRALEEVREGPGRRIWLSVLGCDDLSPADWRELDGLEPLRAARLMADLESVLPGSVPRDRLRAVLSSLGDFDSGWLRGRLERALEGPWSALEDYLEGPTGDDRRLADLFHRAGLGDARLIWRRGTVEHELVAGQGGASERRARLGGGSLILTAARIDGVARALFALVLRDWRPPSRPGAPESGMVAESPGMLAALDRARRLAAREIPVLITGETGTGKELLARFIHRHSPREGPLLPVNSAALSDTLILSELFGHVRGAFTGAERDRPGIFESARGGTVFLDEIGDLPLNAQAMLLRVLQEGEVRRLGESRPRPVDVRVLAATHRRLDRMVEGGRFRADLFYRLAVGTVELPPLRNRGDDLELLTEHFLARADARKTLTPAAAERLRAHLWPGNVRELGNCLSVAVALAEADRIHRRHLGLPETEESPPGGYHQRVLELRRRLVKEALASAGGNRAAAARRLGMSRQALSYLVRTLGLR
jgi:transcriptional regulator with AAA-type ATPase domain